MMPLRNHQPNQSGLELSGNWEDQRWELRAQRIGWGVFALLVTAALAGLLGHGPLSSAQAGDPAGPLWVEYNRFERYKGPTELRIHVKPEAARDGKLRLWFSRSMLDQVELERVKPQPDTVEVGPDRHTFVFNAPNLTRETTITFRHLPDRKFANLTVRIGLEPGPTLQFSQFIYP